MNTEKAKVLLTKYSKGELNAEEEALLNQWYISAVAESKEVLSETQLNESYLFLKNNLPLAATPKKIKLWPRIVAVAAAVALILLGVYFFNTTHHSGEGQNSTLANADIAPGKNTATLTLANGRIINLDTNKNSVVVADSIKTFTTLTASTPRGGTYRITLPDGTQVWLNADSKITFPSQFTGEQRNIALEGEAYFQVAKDKAHPFVVTSNGQQVEVLGTHFNINSYKDEPGISTSLVEGSVKVKSGSIEKIIKPGEQALNRNGKLVIQAVDLDKVIDWKNGDFNLNHVDFKTAMRKIGRWYDVEVVYDASVPDSMEAGGWMSRNNKLSDVLEAIEASGHAKFRIEGKKIIVHK